MIVLTLNYRQAQLCLAEPFTLYIEDHNTYWELRTEDLAWKTQLKEQTPLARCVSLSASQSHSGDIRPMKCPAGSHGQIELISSPTCHDWIVDIEKHSTDWFQCQRWTLYVHHLGAVSVEIHSTIISHQYNLIEVQRLSTQIRQRQETNQTWSWHIHTCCLIHLIWWGDTFELRAIQA